MASAYPTLIQADTPPSRASPLPQVSSLRPGDGYSYRVPCQPGIPGARMPPSAPPDV